MSLACTIIGHKWNGCVCARCGAHRSLYAPRSDPQRYGGHEWNGCVCAKCGAMRRLYDKETPERDEWHDWDGCTCRKCKQTRDEDHDWNGCTCRKCGKRRNEGHIDVYVRTDIDNDYGHVENAVYRCKICGRETYRLTSDLGEPQAF